MQKTRITALALALAGSLVALAGAPAVAATNGASVPMARPASNGGDVAATIENDGSSLTILPATGPEPADLQALAPTIGCTLNVQNVHPSTHVNGNINGVARINCTGPAGELQIHYSLIRLSPYTQWGGPSKTNGGYPSIQTNRAVPCTAGPAQFRGWAQGFIAPPPGYSLTTPPSKSLYGNTTSVACGVTRAASAARGDESVEEENTAVFTVTFTRNDLLQVQ